MTDEQLSPDQESFLSYAEVQLQRGLEQERCRDWIRQVSEYVDQLQDPIDEDQLIDLLNRGALESDG